MRPISTSWSCGCTDYQDGGSEPCNGTAGRCVTRGIDTAKLKQLIKAMVEADESLGLEWREQEPR